MVAKIRFAFREFKGNEGETSSSHTRTTAPTAPFGLAPAGFPVALRRSALGFSILFAALLLGCQTQGTQQPAANAPPPPPPPPEEHIPPPAQEEDANQAVKILTGVGFKTPKSAYYDTKRDVYLVSNINGGPLDADDNGFISKLTPEGELTLKFIDGADSGIELNAPKGLTVSGDTLYVADINKVRTFDAATGAAKEVINFPGATFINAVATGKDGIVYVSDSGLDATFQSTGTDTIYTIRGTKIKKLLSDKKKLGSPSGLLAGADGVWVVTFGSGQLYWVTNKGKIEAAQKMPGGQNDGIVMSEDGRFLVSSWEKGIVYSGKPGEEFKAEISGVDEPAGIGYDCKRNRALIPLFKKDSVILHTLSTAEAAAE